jgi:hypothetical protein
MVRFGTSQNEMDEEDKVVDRFPLPKHVVKEGLIRLKLYQCVIVTDALCTALLLIDRFLWLLFSNLIKFCYRRYLHRKFCLECTASHSLPNPKEPRGEKNKRKQAVSSAIF